MILKSKYKVFGGFGLLLLLNVFSITMLGIVFSNLKSNPFDVDSLQNGKTVLYLLFFLVLLGLTILLFITQCKLITICKDGLIFKNPILPFLNKKRNWNDYDYYQTVQEYSRAGFYEAIWLIKDNKLKDRISSFYYSNYVKIKAEIKTKNMGQLEMDPFSQFFCLLGIRIK